MGIIIFAIDPEYPLQAAVAKGKVMHDLAVFRQVDPNRIIIALDHLAAAYGITADLLYFPGIGADSDNFAIAADVGYICPAWRQIQFIGRYWHPGDQEYGNRYD